MYQQFVLCSSLHVCLTGLEQSNVCKSRLVTTFQIELLVDFHRGTTLDNNVLADTSQQLREHMNYYPSATSATAVGIMKITGSGFLKELLTLDDRYWSIIISLQATLIKSFHAGLNFIKNTHKYSTTNVQLETKWNIWLLPNTLSLKLSTLRLCPNNLNNICSTRSRHSIKVLFEDIHNDGISMSTTFRFRRSTSRYTTALTATLTWVWFEPLDLNALWRYKASETAFALTLLTQSCMSLANLDISSDSTKLIPATCVDILLQELIARFGKKLWTRNCRKRSIYKFRGA